MENHHLWQIMEAALASLAERFEPLLERKCSEAMMDRRVWGLLLAVYTFEPDETSAGHLMIRSPYTSVDSYMNRLRSAAHNVLLDEVSPGTFRLTDHGRSITLQIVQAIREVMAHSDPLLPADSGRLAVLLDRLVQACLQTPPPPETWSISLSNKLIPALNPPMPFIEQSFSCLAAYRDDSHLAAWRRSGLSAMALETLTLLWRGEVTSLDELCKRLERRGHPCQVYNNVLGELREHGFITGPAQAPWVTGTGRVFRNEIEEDTDRFFYAPWSVLKTEEKMELLDLATRMRDGLR